MMEANNEIMPIKHLISFDELLKHYDVMAKSEDAFLAQRAQHILDAQKPYPVLRDGFEDVSLLEVHKDVIALILQDSFAEVLAHNEIKAATLPYQNIIFNSSRRFQNILKNAGPGFNPVIRNQSGSPDYIMACIVILNFHYGFKLDFARPYFYNIPDENGVLHHYRILYNADFIKIIPTEKAKEITREEVDELLENPNDLELWMEKIPPESFISKGFAISNMFDVTAEHSISEIKSELIGWNKGKKTNFMADLQKIFRSFFGIPDLRVGFVVYNSEENQLEPVYGKGLHSFILNGMDPKTCATTLCGDSYRKLLEDYSYIAVSDIDRAPMISEHVPAYEELSKQGLKSAIFAPVASGGELLGILEIVSGKKEVLNAVNAQKLDDVMPYIAAAALRSKVEVGNYIDAIIQKECTSVHSSVYWKFKEEAKNFIKDQWVGKQPSFKEIVFKDVNPLYGQTDIKDSSHARNTAIQRDLMIQLSEINDILLKAWERKKLPILEELMFRVSNHLDSIKEMLFTNSEQNIFDFVRDEVAPVFEHLKKIDAQLKKEVLLYEDRIDTETESYYDHRKNYDESVMRINEKLASVMDRRQTEAQEMFPHYFERYKTDGIEHNMYIGSSISGNKEFDTLYLNNLRLWQLQVMCEMENTHHNLKSELPVKLDVASLILVYNTSLAIRFRMDEKRFDVDGTYNARYEIIKKRIDKSFIKGTNERLTQKGKLAIVYSQKKDELEYLRYIKFLRSKGCFTDKIEIVELEGLQGVSGLKAIRAEIVYADTQKSEKTYTYEDLMEELKA